MAQRIFKGINETMAFEEVDALSDKMLTQILFDIAMLVDECTEDEENRATAKVDYARKLGNFRNACILKGLLMDPDDYIRELNLPEGVVAYFEEEGVPDVNN